VIVDDIESYRGLYTRRIFEILDDVPSPIDGYVIDGEPWGHSFYEYVGGDAIDEEIWLKYGSIVNFNSPFAFHYKAISLLDDGNDSIISASMRYRTQYGTNPSDEELYLWLKAGEPNDR